MLGGLLLMGSLLSGAVAAPVELPPTPRFRHYGVSEGLPSSRVYATVQDRSGYIWVGTGDGLARFDGQRFRVYRHDPKRADSLASNDVSALLVDDHGRLWVGGGDNGLNRLNAEGTGFEHWLHDADQVDSLSGNDVMGLAQDAGGRIWVGVYAGGLNRLRPDGKGFEHWRHKADDPDSLASDNVMSLYAGPAGRLWVGSDKGLDLIEPDGHLRHIPFEGADNAPWVWQIRGQGDDVRLGTSSGLYRVGQDGVARRWPGEEDQQGDVFASLRGPGGDVWVGGRGALRLHTADGHTHQFPTQPMMPGGLPARTIVDLESDREGGLWLSSADAGLLYLGPDWRDFSRFSHVPEDPDSLASSRVMSLAVDDTGKLLVGGMAGQLDLLDPATGRALHLGGKGKLPATSVLSLATDGPDEIWIGMQGHLYRHDGKGIREVGDARLHTGIRDLLVLPDHSLLVSPLGKGMLRVDPQSLVVTAVPLAFDAVEAGQTLHLAQVGNAVWRASKGGLSYLTAEFARFEPVPGVTPGRVNAFAVQGDQVWLARPDVLELYHREGTRLALQRTVTTRDGFPAININRLFTDADGRVWMTSRVGLWRFAPASGRFHRYGVVDGLPSPEFTDTLVHLPAGTVFAGTLSGVVGFRPDDLHDHARRPEIALEEISVQRDGRRVPLAPEAGALRLAWDERNLRVSVKALSYVNPSRNHYRFRMEGFDSGWVDTGARGSREFTGLPAGHYTLQVQAAGPGNAWAALPHPMVLEVAAPPWRTPIAWLVYLLAALLLLIAFWRMLKMRMQRRMEMSLLHEQRRLAEEANAAKTRFLATMGHEIRTPMTGVLGMAELLTHTQLDPEQADMVGTIRHSGEVLLKLVNDALDLARIEAGRFELDTRPLDPVAVMHEVAALEAGLARSKKIEIRIETGDDIPARVLGDAIRLRQILLNLASNALKFTEQGKVTLALDVVDGKLRYRVRDSGPGMDADLKRRLFRRFEQGDSGSNSGGSGLGLAICKELVGLMGGTIAVDSEPGVGSTFTVILPLQACATGPRTNAAEDRSPAHAQRVLLVEDDATIARVLVGLLRRQGHTACHAANALAALAELDAGSFDTVLVDIDLPDLDGFELITMLRARPDGRRWRIIVVTARSNRADEARAEAAGADGFLRKPVSGHQLQAALEPDRPRN